MKRVLLTSFNPFGAWSENSSWLCLMELLRNRPTSPEVTTRRYPVDFAQARELLAKDLRGDFDYVVSLGQAASATRVQIETTALNLGGEAELPSEWHSPLEADGPAAYRTSLPVARFVEQIRAAGIPCQASHHAGTYLCNATYYRAFYLAQRLALKTQPLFVHLPLDTTQAAQAAHAYPSLPAALAAAALRVLLADLADL